jgi:aldose 1-epimerase
MSNNQPPSGEQIVLRHGDQTAVIVEVGGGVRTYSVAGHEVLDGYAEDAQCDAARGQSLIPWPNRVQDGKWSWQGHDLQLPLTEPEQHNAIHGLCRWASWQTSERTDSAVTMTCTVAPQPGYPWWLAVSNRWTLDDAGLAVTTTVTNRSDTAAPVAVGFHPYLSVGTPTVDTALLTLPADTRIVTGPQQIPTGTEPVEGSDFDFRVPRPLGALAIDFAFADLARDDDGLVRLRLQRPNSDVSVALWADAAYPYLEVFTGDALPDPSRRRQGLGVEPMSAPPNALATGEAVVAVAPGESWVGSWGVATTGY